MATLVNPLTWGMSRDEEGHREYKVTYRVQVPLLTGPAAVLGAAGLPSTGSTYSCMGDVDAFAYCKPDVQIDPDQQKDGEPFALWKVTKRFSTKFTSKRCQDTAIEDPLDEPIKYGGSFIKYTEEALKDKDGNPISSLSGQRITGPGVEFDANRPTVWTEKNVASLPLSLIAGMLDKVNSGNMWGLSKRCIKFSAATWERKYKGSCVSYYTVRYEFDVRYDTFDREVLDFSDKCLNGKWVNGVWATLPGMSVTNPTHWGRYSDRAGNLTKCPLTDGGTPALSEAQIRKIPVKKYQEGNLLSLDVPGSF